MAKKTPKQKQRIPMEVVGALADAFDKSVITIIRWIESNDDRLTSEKAKEVFNRKDLKEQVLD